MRNRVLTFIIGILVGAIIATLGFFIYSRVVNSNRHMPPMMNFQGEQMQPGQRGEMRDTRPNEIPNMNHNIIENNKGE